MFLTSYGLDNTMDGYYIAPSFMDNLIVHISNNFMNFPNIKVRDVLHFVECSVYVLEFNGKPFADYNFFIFFVGSTHSWYLGTQRSRKVLPM